MEFIWKGKNQKIKNSTLCNDYEYGGLKNFDIFSKVVSLQLHVSLFGKMIIFKLIIKAFIYIISRIGI